MGNKLVSVFTCVYNRADKIERVFRSLNSQTYPYVEHIIIDDGSTDNVLDLIEDYKKTAKFPVIVHSKTNGGKHTATNIAWDLAHGEYILQLDSDDELLPHAIEYLVGQWDEIPDNQKEEYWCVHGRCKTQSNDDLVGDPYPDGINQLPFKESYALAKMCKGDKVGLMKTKILNEGNYRYPEPEHVKFVTEGVLWRQLNKKYRTWYTNEIVYVYHVGEGESLSHPTRNQQSMSNLCWNYRWTILNRKEYPCALLKTLLIYVVGYMFSSKQYKKSWRFLCVSAREDFLVAFLLPLIYIIVFLFKPFLGRKLNIKN